MLNSEFASIYSVRKSKSEAYRIFTHYVSNTNYCATIQNKIYKLTKTLKKLFFYWVTSFILGTIIYYILWIILPHHNVFGSLYRMFLYHWSHPISFIAIPCFFYGIMATLFADKYLNQTLTKQILLTILIIFLTILLSSPFGGMLWHYYDMKAGYFPPNWISKMIKLGFEWGLGIGWLVILLSIPYNIIGSIICYFLTKKGSELFRKE